MVVNCERWARGGSLWARSRNDTNIENVGLLEYHIRTILIAYATAHETRFERDWKIFKNKCRYFFFFFFLFLQRLRTFTRDKRQREKFFFRFLLVLTVNISRKKRGTDSTKKTKVIPWLIKSVVALINKLQLARTVKGGGKKGKERKKKGRERERDYLIAVKSYLPFIIKIVAVEKVQSRSDRIVAICGGKKTWGCAKEVGRERERSHQCFLNCVRTISWKKTSTFVPESILISSNVNLWMDVSRHYQTGWIVSFGMCHVSSRRIYKIWDRFYHVYKVFQGFKKAKFCV